MKVAIVGTSHALTENEERDIRQFCAMVLKEEHTDILVSGGARGVDSIAEEVAQGLGIQLEVHLPKSMKWEDYKKRNIEIAESCDKLICITTPVHDKKCYHHKQLIEVVETRVPEHQKTAGCWTMKEALKLNKECKLLITPER